MPRRGEKRRNRRDRSRSRDFQNNKLIKLLEKLECRVKNIENDRKIRSCSRRYRSPSRSSRSSYYSSTSRSSFSGTRSRSPRRRSHSRKRSSPLERNRNNNDYSIESEMGDAVQTVTVDNTQVGRVQGRFS